MFSDVLYCLFFHGSQNNFCLDYTYFVFLHIVFISRLNTFFLSLSKTDFTYKLITPPHDAGELRRSSQTARLLILSLKTLTSWVTYFLCSLDSSSLKQEYCCHLAHRVIRKFFLIIYSRVSQNRMASSQYVHVGIVVIKLINNTKIDYT